MTAFNVNTNLEISKCWIYIGFIIVRIMAKVPTDGKTRSLHTSPLNHQTCNNFFHYYYYYYFGFFLNQSQIYLFHEYIKLFSPILSP